jgi:hypothetical protein
MRDRHRLKQKLRNKHKGLTGLLAVSWGAIGARLRVCACCRALAKPRPVHFGGVPSPWTCCVLRCRRLCCRPRWEVAPAVCTERPHLMPGPLDTAMPPVLRTCIAISDTDLLGSLTALTAGLCQSTSNLSACYSYPKRVTTQLPGQELTVLTSRKSQLPPGMRSILAISGLMEFMCTVACSNAAAHPTVTACCSAESLLQRLPASDAVVGIRAIQYTTLLVCCFH